MAERTPLHDAEALLALAVTKQTPAGACPDLEEIAAWHEGGLASDRREAVAHHVAHCDACFAVWTGLLDSADLLAAATAGGVSSAAAVRPRRRRWLPNILPGFGTGGLAAGFAVVLMLAVLVPILRQPSLEARVEAGFEEIARSGVGNSIEEQWPWPAGYQSRAIVATDPTSGVAAQAFRAGLAAGLEQATPANDFWARTIAALSANTAACANPDAPAGCEAISGALFTAGRWAALVHLACAVEARSSADVAGLSSAFWTAQADVLAQLSDEVASVLPDSPFSRLLGQWHDQVEKSGEGSREICARSSTLVTLGLGS